MDTLQIDYFMGGASANYIIAAMLWACVGVVIWKFIHYQRRTLKVKFDLWYFIDNNLYPLAFNFILTLAFVRFTSDIVEYLNLEFLHFGKDPMFVYILFGLGQQIIIDFLRKKFRKDAV